VALNGVAIIVMARCPAAGEVKAGLVGLLSAGEAAAIQGVFIRHMVSRLDRLGPAEMVICFEPPEAEYAMQTLIGEMDVSFVSPAGKDPGERMARAIERLGKKHAKVLVVGVDTPDVPLEQLFAAAELAEKVAVFVGPRVDGRCWCIGVWNKVEAGGLLENIAWGTDKEARQVLEHAGALGYSAGKLEPWEAVEKTDEMERLLLRLSKSGAAADRVLLAELKRVAPGLEMVLKK